MAIKHRIDELYTAHPFYGSRTLTVLREAPFGPINRKRVQRSMREMGIAGIPPGPTLRKRLSAHRVYPYLVRGVSAQRPHHSWGCDITYIRLRHGWRYLVAISDWCSRYVVSWKLDDPLEITVGLAVIAEALQGATPEIWNTDQGSHFTSPQVTRLRTETGIQIRMDGKGRAIDTIFTERFWRSLKYEELYLADYATPREARQGIARYLTCYNVERPHQALEYRRPAELDRE